MYSYKIFYSKRKTLALEITKNKEIIVRSPYGVTIEVISSFVEKHKNWIEKQLNREFKQEYLFSEKEIEDLKRKARENIPLKVKYYSELMDLYPTSVKITTARTRFGSCSGKNSICFSCFLMKFPEKAIDYVVVHELAHIKHHNHGKEFYQLIQRFIPDYNECIKILKGNN